MVTNVCDGGGTVAVDPDRSSFVSPAGYEKHNDHRLLTPYSLPMEYEMNRRRLDAAKQWTRANPLNRWFGARTGARIGIASAGKGVLRSDAVIGGLRYHGGGVGGAGDPHREYAVTYPLEPEFTAEFADGLETLIVVEEKRSFLEFQIRDSLYNRAVRPQVIRQGGRRKGSRGSLPW